MKRTIKGCRQGDPEAWHELIKKTSPLVHGIANRFGLSPEETEDVCQETYLALYRNLDKVRAEEAIPRWLAVTATRLAQRAKSAQVQARSRVSIDANPDFEAWERAALADAVSPEEAMALEDGLRALPTKCQAVLRALFFEGLSYSEASQKLGVAVGSLGSMQSRCLERLAGYFVPAASTPDEGGE